MARELSGAVVAANPDLLGLALTRLAARDLASCALACRRFHASAQLALAVRFLDADVQPTRLALPEHALSIHLTQPFRGGQDLACKYISMLLLGAGRLQELRLEGPLLSERHVARICSATSKLLALTHLSLHCTMLDTAAAALARALPLLTALEELSLAGNLLGDSGLKLLLASLCKLQQLRHLDLRDNALTQSSWTSLAALCDGAPALTALHVNDEGLELPSKLLPTAPLVGRALIKLQPTLMDQQDQTNLPATLRALPRLQTLHLIHSELFTAAGFRDSLLAARRLKRLQSLKLVMATAAWSADEMVLMPAVNQALRVLPGLQSFHVECPSVADSNKQLLMSTIADLHKLTHLGLYMHNHDLPLGDIDWQASRHWVAMLAGCPCLRSLSFSLASSFPWQQLHTLVPQLTRIEVYSPASLEPQLGASSLTALTALQEVVLSVVSAHSAVTMQLLAQLLSGGAVTSLEIAETMAVDAYTDDWRDISQTLGALTRLRKLDIEADSSTALGFFIHGEFNRWPLTLLTALKLGYSPLRINMLQLHVDMVADMLPCVHSVQRLSVQCCVMLAFREFAEGLRQLTSLTALELNGCVVAGPEGPMWRGPLPQARDLSGIFHEEPPDANAMDDTNWCRTDVLDPENSDDFAQALAGLTRLQVLSICGIGAVAWSGGLVSLQQLTCLQLMCLRVHLVAAVELAGVLNSLPQLGALRLEGAQIEGGVTELFAQGLKGLTSLQHLSLRCLDAEPCLPWEPLDEGRGLGKYLDKSMQQVACVLEHIAGLCVLELDGTGAGEQHLKMLSESISGTDRILVVDLEAASSSESWASQFIWRSRRWFDTMWQSD